MNQQLSPDRLLNLLQAEKELTILLPVSIYPNFKTTMYRLKKRQEEQLIGLEMLSEEEVRQLSFSTSPSQDQEGFLEVTMKLATRPRNITYTILTKVVKTEADGK